MVPIFVAEQGISRKNFYGITKMKESLNLYYEPIQPSIEGN